MLVPAWNAGNSFTGLHNSTGKSRSKSTCSTSLKTGAMHETAGPIQILWYSVSKGKADGGARVAYLGHRKEVQVQSGTSLSERRSGVFNLQKGLAQCVETGVEVQGCSGTGLFELIACHYQQNCSEWDLTCLREDACELVGNAVPCSIVKDNTIQYNTIQVGGLKTPPGSIVKDVSAQEQFGDSQIQAELYCQFEFRCGRVLELESKGHAVRGTGMIGSKCGFAHAAGLRNYSAQCVECTSGPSQANTQTHCTYI